jgi:transposase
MADVMHEDMLDARQEGGSYRRIEVITGQRRRRQWTAEEKARIVAESFEEGANISEVARRHGVVRGLLTVWRHKFATAAGLSGTRLRAGPDHFRERSGDGRRAGSAGVRA